MLRPIGACSTVAALDLTFSAPKSVSVLFAIGDEGMASALLEAHERAVDAALAYLEREACFTRRGHGGVERLRGEGFIAASYRHRMSRAGDPPPAAHASSKPACEAPTLPQTMHVLDCQRTGEDQSRSRCVSPEQYVAELRRRDQLARGHLVGGDERFKLHAGPESRLILGRQLGVELLDQLAAEIRAGQHAGARRRHLASAGQSVTGRDDITLYTLRHTHASLCHYAGLTVPEAARRLGHSPALHIATYAHVIEGLQGRRFDGFDELIEASREELAGGRRRRDLGDLT